VSRRRTVQAMKRNVKIYRDGTLVAEGRVDFVQWQEQVPVGSGETLPGLTDWSARWLGPADAMFDLLGVTIEIELAPDDRRWAFFNGNEFKQTQSPD
jgi:hypothetical protein